MRKIINAPENFVDEVIDGILAAHPEQLRAVDPDRRALVRADAGTRGRVGIVTGGGSGHLPLFLGYVGQGLASGVAVGNVFSSPSPAQIHAATMASDDGAGVLYLYGNYGGDVYNFDLAADMAATQGVTTRTVLGHDDVASAPAKRANTRRGVAGLFFAYKTAGAAAERGDDLDSVAAIAERTCARTRTMGVGLSPTILPAAGEPTFELGEGEMEIGIGIHGEPGMRRGPLISADTITDEFLTAILPELPDDDNRVAVLVNGLGATPLEELYLIYRRVHQVLADREITITHRYIGEYATSLEMAGASVSILALDDDLSELLDAPAESPFYRHRSAGVDTGKGSSTRTDTGTDAETGIATDPLARVSTDITVVDHPSALRTVIIDTCTHLPDHAEHLRKLDAAVGDGDLGLTVSVGAKAVAEALDELPENAAPSAILTSAASAFGSANPSTFAALISTGLLAAASVFTEDEHLTSATLHQALAAMTQRIAERGGARLGDKTLLDVLDAVTSEMAEHLESETPSLAARLATRAADVVTEQQQLPAQRGRAAWVGERSIGHPDPGQVAIATTIDTIAHVLSDQRRTS